jgi:hypothetical protein
MRIVVRRQRPLVAFVTGLVLCATLAGSIWWLLERERGRVVTELERLRHERDRLKSSATSLARDKEGLARRVAILERARQVEFEAYGRVEQELATLQQQILELKEEVVFYRGIVTDGNKSGKVRIQRFVLEPESTPRDFRFRLVLTRGMGNDKVASGAVTLAVDGDRGGERLRLDLQDLAPIPAGPLEFNFKHFQRIEGRLTLPEGFEPRRVVVHVDTAPSGSEPLRETFQWPSMRS